MNLMLIVILATNKLINKVTYCSCDCWLFVELPLGVFRNGV